MSTPFGKPPFEQQRPSGHPSGLSEQLLKPLTDTYLRLRNAQAWEAVWQRLLSARERSQVGDSEHAYCRLGNPVRLLMELRPRVWQPRLIIDAGFAVGLLGPQEHHWLGRELLLHDPLAPAPRRPAGLEPRPGELDAPERIELARNRSRLVLVEAPGYRRCYWCGEPVSVNWFKRKALWEVLRLLVTNRIEGGGGIDQTMLGYDEGRALPNRKSALKNILPWDLALLIKHSNDTGTYSLMLPQGDVEFVTISTTDAWALDGEADYMD